MVAICLLWERFALRDANLMTTGRYVAVLVCKPLGSRRRSLRASAVKEVQYPSWLLLKLHVRAGGRDGEFLFAHWQRRCRLTLDDVNQGSEEGKSKCLSHAINDLPLFVVWYRRDVQAVCGS